MNRYTPSSDLVDRSILQNQRERRFRDRARLCGCRQESDKVWEVRRGRWDESCIEGVVWVETWPGWSASGWRRGPRILERVSYRVDAIWCPVWRARPSDQVGKEESWIVEGLLSICAWPSQTLSLSRKQQSTAGTSDGSPSQGNKGSWKPSMHWKGVSPVDCWRREFWAYSAQPIKWFQECWWPWQKVLRKHPISWIFLSVCPLVCGWYPDDRLTVTPRSLRKFFHTLEMNWGPRSDTISSGMPKYLNTWLNICSAVSIAVGRFLSGIKRQDLENLSTTTTHVTFGCWQISDEVHSMVQVWPWSHSKSKCDHGLTPSVTMVGWLWATGEVYQLEDGVDSLSWHTLHNPGWTFSPP